MLNYIRWYPTNGTMDIKQDLPILLSFPWPSSLVQNRKPARKLPVETFTSYLAIRWVFFFFFHWHELDLIAYEQQDVYISNMCITYIVISRSVVTNKNARQKVETLVNAYVKAIDMFSLHSKLIPISSSCSFY